jgi:hypothetical protein
MTLLKDIAESTGPVESLYEDYQGLVSDLSLASPSGLAALNRSYHKHLLVAAASSLEDRVKGLIVDIFDRHGAPRLREFVSSQVIVRGYHTLFDWKNETAAPFFSSFGKECGSDFRTRLKSDESLKADHDAFMRLGNLRNQIVHNDYATSTIELTPDEVIGSYRAAIRFTERFEELILTELHTE